MGLLPPLWHDVRRRIVERNKSRFIRGSVGEVE
jgi:hypothetical protein